MNRLVIIYDTIFSAGVDFSRVKEKKWSRFSTNKQTLGMTYRCKNCHAGFHVYKTIDGSIIMGVADGFLFNRTNRCALCIELRKCS